MKILYAGMVDVDGDRADKIHFVSLARALHSMGHELFVLAHGRHVPAELAGSDIRLMARDVRPGISRPWNDVRMLASLVRLGLEARCDVLYHRGVPLANRWARLASLPAIVEVNGIHVDELQSRGAGGRRLRLFSLREQQIIRGATRVICVTSGLRDQVIQRYGVQPDRCVVIENGTDTERFRPRPRQECFEHTGLSGETFNVGFVGAFQAWIDFESMLQAAKRLSEQAVPIQVILVGDGPFYAEVAQRKDALGLGQVVRQVGRVPHATIPTWLGAFDVCVAPSGGAYVQAIGKSSMKLFEYMACSRPVVATAVPGEGELIAAAHAGLLYQPGDDATLAGHLVKLYHNPELREQMGSHGRAYVVQHHSWDCVAKRTEAVMAAAMQSV
jgi:glycosyltransferase involved in cell wall biosynthesis